MKETGKNNLLRSIADLPESNMDPDLWSNVEEVLDDKSTTSTIINHNPGKKNRRYTYYLIASAIVILLVSGYFMIRTISSESRSIENDNITSNEQGTNKTTTQTTQQNLNNEEIFSGKTETNDESRQPVAGITEEPAKSGDEPKIFPGQLQDITVQNRLIIENRRNKYGLLTLETRKNFKLALPTIEKQYGKISERTSLTRKQKSGPHVEKNPALAFGLSYNYIGESYLSPNEDIINVNKQGIDILFQIRKRKLIITSGIGYVKSIDRGIAISRFKTNELITTYNYVDTVIIDPVTFERQYITVNVELYDSVPYRESLNNIRAYSYIKIPLAVKYLMLQTGKLSFYGLLGAEYFYETKHNDSYSFILPPNSSAIHTDIITPERRKTNLKLIGGLELEYAFLNDFRISLQANTGQYIRPWILPGGYKSGNFSYSIHAGIVYNIREFYRKNKH